MQLQSETYGKVIREYPFGELLRVKKAVGAITGAGRVFAERGRKQDRVHTIGKSMALGKVAGKFVVRSSGEHKLDLVLFSKGFEILNAKGIGLAGVGAFHVHDFNDPSGNLIEWALSAGFEKDLITLFQQLLHKRDQVTLLQHGLAAGDLD